MKPMKLGIVGFLVLITVGGVGSIIYTNIRLRHHQEFISDYGPNIERIEKAQGKTITLTETKNGTRKWLLKMKEIKYSKDNSVAKLIEVQGLVYGDNQEVLFTFESPTGEYYKANSRVVLNDGAKMISPKAKVMIRAPKMDWSSETDQVTASGGVEMAKEDFGTSRANQATFAMDFSQIQFIGNATSVIGGHPNIGD